MKNMNFNIIQKESENTNVTVNLQINGSGNRGNDGGSDGPSEEKSHVIGYLISEHLKKIQIQS